MIHYFIPNIAEAEFPSFITILAAQLKKCRRRKQDIVILCIGTPLLFADSLGPLTGSLLRQSLSYREKKDKNPSIWVYGTMSDPVHALNYKEKLRRIRRRHRHAFLIAIDASLGDASRVGLLTLQKGKLCPGAGIPRKDSRLTSKRPRALTPVGHLSLTGIVQNADTDTWSSSPLNFQEMYRMAVFLSRGVLSACLLERKIPS